MKIKIDIEASPQELRAFFGLPDIAGLQEELIEQMRKRIEESIEGFNPATLIQPFALEHLRSLETLQRNFWEALLEASKKKAD